MRQINVIASQTSQNALYISQAFDNLPLQSKHMRTSFSLLAVLGAVTLMAVGCAGPERKFGRGMLNVTEFTRMGEIRRSMEQTALWENKDGAYTTGFMHGFNRSLARTAVGAYEVVTAPFPPYDPVFLPE